MGAGSMASERNPVPDALGVPDAPRLLTSASGGFGMSFFELDCFTAILLCALPSGFFGILFAVSYRLDRVP
jgi:hypothetical protein